MAAQGFGEVGEQIPGADRKRSAGLDGVGEKRFDGEGKLKLRIHQSDVFDSERRRVIDLEDGSIAGIFAGAEATSG